MLPKAVLFDFDGVIVDSFNAHYNAWSKAFTQLFDKEIPPFPHATHAGKAPILIATYFCEQERKPELAQQLFELKGRILHENEVPPALLPGVREIQSFLAEKNIPYGIASNATRDFLKNSISHLELQFETYLGLENYIHPKPHPEPYLLLAEKLHLAKVDYSEIWICEDSLTGTAAAKASGMMPIGIMTQYTKEELEACGSQMVFPTLLEAYYFLLKNA